MRCCSAPPRLSATTSTRCGCGGWRLSRLARPGVQQGASANRSRRRAWDGATRHCYTGSNPVRPVNVPPARRPPSCTLEQQTQAFTRRGYAMASTTSAGDLRAAARALGPRLLKLADEIERERQLPAELVEAFRTVGI